MTRRLEGTVIVGLGVTGLSCLRFLHDRVPRGTLSVVDTRPAPPNLAVARRDFADVEIRCGGVEPGMLAGADRIVVSPGISLASCLLADAIRAGVPLTSDIALFLAEARAPVIAITGTNGKSTVTALTGHLLAAAGLDVGVGGNIGRPALDLLAPGRDAYVLELSSFQLERLDRVGVEAASILNVTPDHLDRYPDQVAYAAAKQRVYEGCRLAVFNRHDPWTRPPPSVSSSCSVGLDAPADGDFGIVVVAGRSHFAQGARTLCATDAIRLRGRHNAQNALAALALASSRIGLDARLLDALAAFDGLPHRCVTVGTVAGVTYIDDSKATNLGACLAALEGLGDATRRHIVLIAGGDAKGIELAPLGAVVAKYVHHVVTLGRDAASVEAAVAGVAPTVRVASMREAVDAARAVARPGDVVLLSPACSSLDMFRNFEARGHAFAESVGSLPR
jgi:UDP-N-acetylmuramoylalanine--D-glutamate ligase